MKTDVSWTEEALAVARFRPYLTQAGGDLPEATNLYWWNLEVASAFYPALHFLELSLRNGLHRCLESHFGRADWWNVAPLNETGLWKVREAARHLRAPAPDDVIADLTLGFWVSLMSKTYDRTLWIPALRKAFRGQVPNRADMHRDFRSIALFRNRIMHHEPIHHRCLEVDHLVIMRLLSELSPATATELATRDPVPAILARRP